MCARCAYIYARLDALELPPVFGVLGCRRMIVVHHPSGVRRPVSFSYVTTVFKHRLRGYLVVHIFSMSLFSTINLNSFCIWISILIPPVMRRTAHRPLSSASLLATCGSSDRNLRSQTSCRISLIASAPPRRMSSPCPAADKIPAPPLHFLFLRVLLVVLSCSVRPLALAGLRAASPPVLCHVSYTPLIPGVVRPRPRTRVRVGVPLPLPFPIVRRIHWDATLDVHTRRSHSRGLRLHGVLGGRGPPSMVEGGGGGKQRRERREDSRSGRLEGRRRIEA